ncbi:hypothetical protein HZA98_04765 [Candidatus Woesearchaeota archaeon]|nr:hypothetical protein [Candidatus Woesearchaeota archaeon]
MAYSLEWRLARAGAEGATPVHRVERKSAFGTFRMDRLYFVENERLFGHGLIEQIPTRTFSSGEKYVISSALPPQFKPKNLVSNVFTGIAFVYALDWLRDVNFPSNSAISGLVAGGSVYLAGAYFQNRDDREAWNRYKELKK